MKINRVRTLETWEYLKYKFNIPSIRKNWWLSQTSETTADSVSMDGDVANNRTSKIFGNRPVIDFSGNTTREFDYKGYRWTVIAPGKAICNDITGLTAFTPEAKLI